MLRCHFAKAVDYLQRPVFTLLLDQLRYWLRSRCNSLHTQYMKPATRAAPSRRKPAAAHQRRSQPPPPRQPQTALALAPQGARYLAIANTLIADILRGRWAPGAKLPSSRALAESLGVHRNTVLAALREVAAQGFTTTLPARGVFVSSQLPTTHIATPKGQFATANYTLPLLPKGIREDAQSTPAARRGFQFSAGMPDARLFPTAQLAASWRRVVSRSRGRLLEYGAAQGHPALRRALANLIRETRGVAATPQHVLVTRGSQMALDVCARALLRPGARVAVEAFGYAPAWNALRFAGIELVPLPVDGEGLVVSALQTAHRQQRIDAVYTTPHHQYPTTVTMSQARRLALGAWAASARAMVFEDDYDHEFHYASRPIVPLAAGPHANNIVYIGTLSKVLAPGLRQGFVLAPPAVIERLSLWRMAMDRQGDQATEAAVAEFIDDGLLLRHMRRMRQTYHQRRDALAEALTQLGELVTFNKPAGGISLWLHVHGALRRHLASWRATCAQHGVVIGPGSRYTFTGEEPHALRLVFAHGTPRELRHAVAIMCAALPRHN